MTVPAVEEFSVAAGCVDITPQRPVLLAGYSGRTEQTFDVADGLEANALLVCGGGTKAVLITLDTLYPGRLLRNQLLQALALAEEELFLAASHTHFAPMLAPDLESLGAADLDYLSFVSEKIAGLVSALGGQLTKVQGTFHSGYADHSMNRRLKRLRVTRSGLVSSVGMAPNPQGERDEEVRALRFGNCDKTIALLWNYTCHPTGFPFPNRISSEYPGFVRKRLRERFGGVPVLFLQGFCGDVRPPFRGLGTGTGRLLYRILWGPAFRAPTGAEWSQWAEGLASIVVEALSAKGAPVQLAVRSARRVVVPESALGTGGQDSHPLIWHNIDCGGFRIIGVNAEPVCGYRRMLLSAYQDKPLFTAGYLDQTHGYLPLESMLPERGYEVDGFGTHFGYGTRFQPGMEKAIMSALRASS